MSNNAVNAYPYLPSTPPSRGRNTGLIFGCAAILLVCGCLLFMAVYVVLTNPFKWNITARLVVTPTSAVSAIPTVRADPSVSPDSRVNPTPTVRADSPTPTVRADSPTPTIRADSPTSTVRADPSVSPTRTPKPTPTYTATKPALSRLTVCMAYEPATLFVYGASSYEQKAILDAIQDGPVDYRTYEYVPVILEDLPTLENGDATVQAVTVHTNDRYVDKNDNLVGWNGTDTKMDQIVITFRLKEGLLWSDGAPLTADDSLFGYEIARDSAASASDYAYLAERTASYTALDSRTVKWVGLPGYTDPLYSTHFFPPVSRQAYGSLTPEQMINDQQVNTTPLGWGPFRIVDWVLGDKITLERNPFYFRAAEGLPYLNEVIFRFVPEEQILTELANGSCDVGTQDYNWEGQLDKLKTSQAAGLLAPQYVKTGYYEHLDFNIQPIDQPVPFFAEVGVRRAVAYCLDRQAITDDAYDGLSAPPDSFLPPDHPFYNPQITHYEFDPQRGLALLKEAGWEDHNGDNILDQNGQKFSLSLYTRANLMRDRIAPLIAQQLRDNCGMDVTVEFHTREELFSPFPDGLVSGRQFDLAEFYWDTSIGWQTCDLFFSNAIPTTDNPSGVNYPGYSNAEYDTVCEAGMRPLNYAERLDNYRRAQAIFTTDLPSLPLFWRLNISVALPHVSGLILDPTAASEFWNIEQVRVNP